MKTVEEFKEAMKSEEMQEAFNKFIEGKECDSAEEAEQLVKDFALENGFELGEGEIHAMAPEDLSDEDLENAAGGLLQDIKKSNGFVQMIGNPDNGVHVFKNDNGLGIFCKPKNDATFGGSDDGPDNKLVIY